MPNLPPEILRMVASHLDRYHLLKLVTTDWYFAWALDGMYYDNWVVHCCKLARSQYNRIYTNVPEYLYDSNLTSFFEGVKNKTAAAFVKKVCFRFCAHDAPSNEEHEDDEVFLEDWPLENTPLELLDCNEVVVSVEYTDNKERVLCNEPLIKHLLRKSLAELNAILKFRLEKPYKAYEDDGYYYVTLHNAKMIPKALSQIRPDGMKNNLWTECELFRRTEPKYMQVYSNVERLTITGTSDKHEDFLQVFPRMKVLIERDWRDRRFPRVAYYFEQNHCIRIVGHAEAYNWIFTAMWNFSLLKYVKELDFHHGEISRSNIKVTSSLRACTQEIIAKLVACVKTKLPNLEVVTFKSSPGTATCDHCNMRVRKMEINAKGLEAPKDKYKASDILKQIKEMY